MRIGLVGAGRIGTVHAATLGSLLEVDEAVVTDLDLGRATALADEYGLAVAADVDALLGSGLDGLVVAAPTPEHPGLLRRAAEAGIAVFCEKPLAPDVDDTRELTATLVSAGVPLQVGFQRRFDPGYQAARDAVGSGELGWIHSVWACTYDQAPPHAAYIPTSGGIFRDCSVHDFDIVRWVTGREVVTVYAQGANRGAAFFAEAGDVDTGSAVLELDDGTQVLLGATRYNGAGHDVRMEVHGSAGSVAVGLDDATPLRSAEAGVGWPGGTAYQHFTQRFAAGYRAELVAFCEVAAGRAPSPCSGEDALAALLIANAAEESRRTRRRVTVDRTPSADVPA